MSLAIEVLSYEERVQAVADSIMKADSVVMTGKLDDEIKLVAGVLNISEAKMKPAIWREFSRDVVTKLKAAKWKTRKK